MVITRLIDDCHATEDPLLDLLTAVVELANADAIEPTLCSERERDRVRYDAELFLEWARHEFAPVDQIPLRRAASDATQRWTI